MKSCNSTFRGAIGAGLIGVLAACSTAERHSGESGSAFQRAEEPQTIQSREATAFTQGAHADRTNAGSLPASVGLASWYGGQFHGRLTASGESFDKNALTAAHRSLPFGTRVRVTNLANGRSLLLTINDRGPFVDGRIIDVSQRAAEQLGFKNKGITRVRLEVMG